MIKKLGLPEDEPIEAKMLTKSIENAQKKVEGNNFSARKRLLDYDKVMNEQREIIYAQRKEVLLNADLKDNILNMVKAVITRSADAVCLNDDDPTDWDMTEFNELIRPYFGFEDMYILSNEDIQTITKEKLIERVYIDAIAMYDAKEAEYGAEMMRELERVITLKVVDTKWMAHIDDMDQMRQGIMLRALAQRDPLIEYQFISYDMFEELSNNIQNDIVKTLFHIKIVTPEQGLEREQVAKPTSTNKDESAGGTTRVRKEPKVGRNDPCPCGSGKKYKQCCGRLE